MTLRDCTPRANTTRLTPPCVSHDRVVDVAAHEQDEESGLTGEERRGQLAAAALGQDDVGEQEVDLGMRIGQRQRRRRAAGLDHAIAAVGERDAGRAPDAGLVLDQQDGLAAARRLRFCGAAFELAHRHGDVHVKQIGRAHV